MSDFEFLRDLPIGQYIPGNSLVHRLDPRTRLLAVGAFVVLLTFEPHTLGLALAVGVSLLGWWLARISPAPAWRGWKAAFPFLVILAIVQVFFHTGPDVGSAFFRIFGKTIDIADLQAGINLILRFSAYVSVLSLASATLTASEITRGTVALLGPLEKLRVPVHDFVMVIQVTLRFFPLLAQTAERVAKSQASRGADWNAKGNILQRVKRMVPLLVPLFVISLRRAESLALAMDARAYGSFDRRTSMIELHFTRKDWLALIIIALVVGAIIWV